MKKRKLIILSSIIILLIVGALIIINAKKLKVNIESKGEVTLNSKKYNTDYLKYLKNGKVVNKNLIDTSKIGKQKVKITIKNFWGQEKDYFIQIEVCDKKKPQITFTPTLETKQGVEIDLLSNVSAKDDSAENIVVTVEGEYDFNKAGIYTLYYVAKDSSGNEAKEKFTLTVSENKTPSSSEKNNSNNSATNDTTFTTSKGYTGVIKNGITYIDGYLIVNKTYSLPSNYGSALTTETKEAFAQMQAAALLDGINIYIASGFRSYQRQNTLYNNYVARDGATKADTFSARAGHSEHQSGLAFDVCSQDVLNGCINSNFNNTAPAKWLSQNSYKYGFILRYPENKTNETGYKYESWHFRYVGTDLATKLYNNGNWLTLEDYFGITSTY